MDDDSENQVWRCELEVSLVSLVCMFSMNRIFRREYSRDIGLGYRRRRSCESKVPAAAIAGRRDGRWTSPVDSNGRAHAKASRTGASNRASSGAQAAPDGAICSASQVFPIPGWSAGTPPQGQRRDWPESESLGRTWRLGRHVQLINRIQLRI
jgi:hypothetical protein